MCARSLVPDLLNASSPFGLSLSKPGCSCPDSLWAGLVEACYCGLEQHARFQGGGRESPGVRVTFFWVAKRKSPKKRRPPVCDPHAVRGGNLRRGGCGVRRRTHCAAVQFRSNNCGESVHEACVSFGTHATPQPPRRRRSQQGWGAEHPTAEHPHGPLLRSAQPAQREALAPARWGRAKQWPVWLFGCWMFGCPPPAGCACGWAVAG